MQKRIKTTPFDEMWVSDCQKCQGFCCSLLYCFRQDGFPADKKPGVNCQHLQCNYTCAIHSQLTQQAFFGCLRYDCLGAGPHLRTLTTDFNECLNSYPNMLQMHQIMFYITQAIQFFKDTKEASKLQSLLDFGICATSSYEALQRVDIEDYRHQVNGYLKKMIDVIKTKYAFDHTSQLTKIDTPLHKTYIGKDFSMQFLVRKDFSYQCLYDTCFLGSDVRDMKVCGSDLSHAQLLTQMQINSMNGDHKTKLPPYFYRPSTWLEKGTRK